MSNRNKILIGLAFLAVIGYILYSSTGLAQVKCEVCVEFRGRTSCRPAFGTTRDEAFETAQSVACADLASGRDDSIACTELTRPKSYSCSE
jgi:hypothetical protein